MTVLLTGANGRTGRAVLCAPVTAGAKARVFIRMRLRLPADL